MTRKPFVLERIDRLLPDGGPTDGEIAERLGVSVERREVRLVSEVPDVWVRQDLGSPWVAAFRLVGTDGRIRVAEARIFPAEPAEKVNLFLGQPVRIDGQLSGVDTSGSMSAGKGFMRPVDRNLVLDWQEDG